MRVAGQLGQEMLARFGDPESRDILGAVASTPRSALEIERVVGLPQSTLYRKISRLRECGLLMVDRFVLRPDGTKEALYLCTFDRLCVRMDGKETQVELIEAPRSVERRWFELFFARSISPPATPLNSFENSY